MADKSAVLAFLRANPESWVSLGDLQSALGVVPDRTVRNWLQALAEEGAIESRGERKGRRYRLRASSPTDTAATPLTNEAQLSAPKSIFSPNSEALIQTIRAAIYTRPPATYREEWIEAYVPNETAYLNAQTRRELATLGKRAPIYRRAGTYIQKIYDRLLIDFSYNSSRLEGNTYSLLDTERLVMQGAAAPGKPDAERIMILNHKEAIRYLVHRADLVANEDTIRTLHYLLSDSLVAPELAGQIRSEGVRVSGSTYSPLEGKERLTTLLNRMLEKARAIADPFEQSIFLLAHISYLQPFIDVNKRTARLASIIPLIKGDYVPQSFVDMDQGAYLNATIVVYELNQVAPLADMYAWSYQRSCQRYDTTAQVIGFDEIAALYRTERRAMVTDLVRHQVPPGKVDEWVVANVPANVEPQHREKFIGDVLAELEYLDTSRIAGLGITREQLEAWKRLSGTSTS
ncbi:MAG TPA: Fic family protein [Steroidobacteraceae bacterium]|jgi:Fic family protein|nr:Fic family protein [Steroidobacteraceae bacterium]